MKTFDDFELAMNRRGFLAGAGGALTGLLLADPVSTFAGQASPKFVKDPFSLGVASGDPWDTSVVLWTRLAPDPVDGGGMPPGNVEVRWQPLLRIVLTR